jgi:hypothetical protein
LRGNDHAIDTRIEQIIDPCGMQNCPAILAGCHYCGFDARTSDMSDKRDRAWINLDSRSEALVN